MTQGWAESHAAACARGENYYEDPGTGYRVLTRDFLAKRGTCCGCGCRHCPFAHASVPLSERALTIQQPAWLHGQAPATAPVVLFWSGGKDSFLALLKLIQESEESVVLLTTFDASHRQVAHQNVSIDAVVAQARTLDLPLLGVPLHPDQDYVEQVRAAFELLPEVAALAFGDLHLEHVLAWRQEAFASLLAERDVAFRLPVWQVPYDVLLDLLEASGAICRISAVDLPAPGVLSVGEVYNRELIARLGEAIDAFGENGEFHTLVEIPGPWTHVRDRIRQVGS